jgi:polyhydroxyalkanoate synthesis regulator protein
VKLDDIARMVRDGSDVRKVDGRTGKDLTHIILTPKERQIAMPLHRKQRAVKSNNSATV